MPKATAADREHFVEPKRANCAVAGGVAIDERLLIGDKVSFTVCQSQPSRAPPRLRFSGSCRPASLPTAGRGR